MIESTDEGTCLTTVSLPDGTEVYFDSQGRWIGTKKSDGNKSSNKLQSKML